LADINVVAKNKEPAPPQGEVTIIVDTFKLKLLLLNNNEPYKTFPIAIGRSSTPTSIGNFEVVHKAAN